MSEQTFMNNLKESATLVGISAGFGFGVKKLLKRNMIEDPSDNFMNAAQWIAVLLVAVYEKDYLIDKKYIPK